jgi:hypothetical protein
MILHQLQTNSVYEYVAIVTIRLHTPRVCIVEEDGTVYSIYWEY